MVSSLPSPKLLLEGCMSITALLSEQERPVLTIIVMFPSIRPYTVLLRIVNLKRLINLLSRTIWATPNSVITSEAVIGKMSNGAFP